MPDCAPQQQPSVSRGELRAAAQKLHDEVFPLVEWMAASGLAEEGGGLALYKKTKPLVDAQVKLAEALAAPDSASPVSRGDAEKLEKAARLCSNPHNWVAQPILADFLRNLAKGEGQGEASEKRLGGEEAGVDALVYKLQDLARAYAATKEGRCPNVGECEESCDCLVCTALTLACGWEDRVPANNGAGEDTPEEIAQRVREGTERASGGKLRPEDRRALEGVVADLVREQRSAA